MAFSTHEHTQPVGFNRVECMKAGGMVSLCILLILVFQTSLPTPTKRDSGPQLTADSLVRQQHVDRPATHAAAVAAAKQQQQHHHHHQQQPQSSSDAAELKQQLARLEAAVAELTGRVDELEVDRRNTARLLDRVLQ